jgi:Predicted permease
VEGEPLLGIFLPREQILFPFLLAGFLVYVLSPVIDRLHHMEFRSYRISRGISVLLVYLVILMVLIGGGSYVIPNVSAEMGRMIQEFPKAVTKLSEDWGPILDEKINSITSLFPEPALEEPLPQPEEMETKNEAENYSDENGELISILNNYTYEIRVLESDRIEVVPHKKNGIESGIDENSNEPLTMKTQLSILAEEGVNRIKSDMVRFLGLGRQLIANVVGSVFTMFLTFMVAAFYSG